MLTPLRNTADRTARANTDDRAPRAVERGVHATLLAFVFLAFIASDVVAQEQVFRLDETDEWAEVEAVDPGSAEGQLLLARRALAAGRPDRAFDLAEAFLDRWPESAFRPSALLLKGDALLALDDEYDALFVYEEIARTYPGSDVFVTALEREYEIALAYVGGKRRKMLGTFRVLKANEDAEELLIRIQERLPGSRLAEKAGIALADHYFAQRDLQMAAEAYDIFIEKYPRSEDADKARLRLIYSFLADYRGPEHDASGLDEARLRLEELRVRRPAIADRVGVDALLVRIYESDAAKLYETARWYERIKDPISAEFMIRRLVERYPASVAAFAALDRTPGLLGRVPEAVRASAPDYEALRRTWSAELEAGFERREGMTEPSGAPGETVTDVLDRAEEIGVGGEATEDGP